MIVDRYLVREAAKPLIAVVALLTGIFMAYSLTRFLTDANEGLLNAPAVAVLTGFKALIALEVLIPIALYIGLIVALGRFYSDQEIAALRAGGVGEGRIIAPVVGLALAIALLVGGLSLFIRPWAYQQLYAFQARAEADAALEDISPGQFHLHGDRDRMLFLESRNGATGELSGLFVRSRAGDELEVISAAAGRLREFARPDAHLLELDDAFVYKQDADARNLFGRFGRFSIWVPGFAPEPVAYRPKAAPTPRLWASSRNEDRAEMQWRMSTAVSTLLLALIAVPLSRTRPRSGRYARVLLAAAIYALYYNFIGIARTGVEQGVLAHLWWAPLGLGMLVAAGLAASRRGHS